MSHALWFPTRRQFLHTLGAGTLALAASPASALAAATAKAPPKPEKPARRVPPGKPGEFDFLAGHWNIANRWRANPDATEWLEFKGESTCWTVMSGVGSVEELRIPERNFFGMGLRVLDVEKKVWMDYFVNAKSGVLGGEGTPGGFEDGAGTFVSEDEEDGRTVLWRGVWDRITPNSCRWHQGRSKDGGRTWDDTWLMDWTRA